MLCGLAAPILKRRSKAENAYPVIDRREPFKTSSRLSEYQERCQALGVQLCAASYLATRLVGSRFFELSSMEHTFNIVSRVKEGFAIGGETVL